MKKVIENKAFFKTITDSLNQKESVSFVVKGSSMSPFLIDQQTEVYLQQKDHYKIKDVCLFVKNDQYFLHRLIKIKNNQYYFRGDHLYRFEIVDSNDVLGYVYQFAIKNKKITSNHWFYRFKVFLYLSYKSVKMMLRKIYRGIRYGR